MTHFAAPVSNGRLQQQQQQQQQMPPTPPPAEQSNSVTEAAYYERAYQAQLAIAMAELQRRKARDVWLARERAARQKAEQELEVHSSLITCTAFLTQSCLQAARATIAFMQEEMAALKALVDEELDQPAAACPPARAAQAPAQPAEAPSGAEAPAAALPVAAPPAVCSSMIISVATR